MTTSITTGDHVRALNPESENWPEHYTATVLRARESSIDVRWDHGPTNYGCDPKDFLPA